jgi:hypothetical protein
LGLGWRKVADAVARAIPIGEVERVWLFPPVRRDEREWGTAVLARRVREDRVRIYTASYRMVVRGRDRGQAQINLDDVGETPDAVLAEVIRGVQERASEAEPPVEIAAAVWWETHDGAAAAG